MLAGKVKDLDCAFDFDFFGFGAVKVRQGVSDGGIFPDLFKLIEDYLGLDFGGFFSEEVAAPADGQHNERSKACDNSLPAARQSAGIFHNP